MCKVGEGYGVESECMCVVGAFLLGDESKRERERERERECMRFEGEHNATGAL